jgi:hypothetical protein
MLYDFSKVLINIDGTEGKEESGKPAYIKTAFINALLSDPQGITTADKAKRFALFLKLQKDESPDLSVDELALLKSAIEVFPTLVYGQLAAFLEQPK